MMPQAALSTASAPPRRESRRPGRVWLIAALVLLAAPLVVAVWGLGGNAAQRERNNADTRLTDRLNSAVREYRGLVSDANAAATTLANKHWVQRELRRSSSHVLSWRILPGRGQPQDRLHRWHRPLPAAAAVRGVDFLSPQGRTVGQVVVFLPLDRRLVTWLTPISGLTGDQELGLVRGHRVEGVNGRLRIQSGPVRRGPAAIRAGGGGYRAVTESLGPTAKGIHLAALEPSSSIDSKASSARWRVMGLGLAVIVAILAFAYAVSPSIARSRVSRQERERAERVLAHVGDGVFLVDHGGVIRLWNPAAEAITGLRGDAICDRSAEETIPGWAMIGARVPVARRPGDVDDASSPETVPLEIDGREIWLSILGVTLGDGIVYAFRDVTRERRLEELRSQFVATISHELRTPLASLHGAAMTLLEREHDLSPQTQHELLDMIAVQSKRLANLVEEILLAGQLDSGSLRVVTEPFDAEELVWTAAAAARLRTGDDTTIDVSIPAMLPKVAGDMERTRQVLTNLLDNAVKYSPHGGRIELGVEADGGYARFTVRDEGLGIPLGEQKRIFEKFYRLDPDHRRGIAGSGLGLYICRELVRTMGGRIWVDSDPGKGATFTFELPVADRVTAPV
jgi:two-component system, OmpR family, phosphate regulon sensor histidine kinase PhoR